MNWLYVDYSEYVIGILCGKKRTRDSRQGKPEVRRNADLFSYAVARSLSSE